MGGWGWGVWGGGASTTMPFSPCCNQVLLVCRFLAGEAGLSLKESSRGGDDGLLAVFDGTQLVFRQSQWGLLTLIRMLWRYGLSYFQLRGWVGCWQRGPAQRAS